MIHHPHIPSPSASTPDKDPTGVRALLASLPEPEPIPDYLVERINASLALEQAKRVASSSGTSLTPLLATARHRPGRFLFAFAGAAAAIVLVAVVGSNLLQANQSTSTSTSAAAAITSGGREAGAGALPSANDKAAPGRVSGLASIAIRLSEVRYTHANFVTQAQILRSGALDPIQPRTNADSAGVGPMGTAAGLTDCLDAIGATGAQLVTADLAFYEGAPAVIIVTTTDGRPTAYVVGRECSGGNAALLRAATPLS